MDSRPLGLMVACATCGGENEWTGRERRGADTGGLGSESIKPEEFELLAELRCKKCGQIAWPAVGTTTAMTADYETSAGRAVWKRAEQMSR